MIRNDQKLSLFENSRGIAVWEMHAVASYVWVSPLKIWGGPHLWSRSAKSGEFTHSSSSKFIGLRMERDS